MAGAIVNKVDLDAKPRPGRKPSSAASPVTASRSSASCPYRPILSNPTLAMVLEGVHGETLNAGPDLDQVIGGVAIGAMEPDHMLERIGPRSLVIVPGRPDRRDPDDRRRATSTPVAKRRTCSAWC